jgi:membrane protease YdiL (CAAX protease family)
LLGLGCTAAVWAAVTWLPLWGSAMGLLKGLAVLLAEIGAALLFAPWVGPGSDRLTGLGLRAPSRFRWLWLAGAAMTAVALVATARTALSLVPATGEAPIQTFVSWPSGMLSFAVLGAVVPVGEEVFFRGFVYRASLGLGRSAAFAITVVLFVAMHARQSWGNWGGLVALLITGAVLTALRAASGSSLVPAFSHLLYNLVLSLRSL